MKTTQLIIINMICLVFMIQCGSAQPGGANPTSIASLIEARLDNPDSIDDTKVEVTGKILFGEPLDPLLCLPTPADPHAPITLSNTYQSEYTHCSIYHSFIEDEDGNTLTFVGEDLNPLFTACYLEINDQTPLSGTIEVTEYLDEWTRVQYKSLKLILDQESIENLRSYTCVEY